MTVDLVRAIPIAADKPGPAPTAAEFVRSTKGIEPLPTALQREVADLQELSLTQHTLSDTELGSIIAFLKTHCPKLTKLTLDGCQGLTTKALIELDKLTTLTSLTFEASSLELSLQPVGFSAIQLLSAACTRRLFKPVHDLVTRLTQCPAALVTLNQILDLSTRVRRATSDGFEKEPVKLADSIHIAHYCITDLLQRPPSDKPIERVSKSVSDLPYSLLYDRKSSVIYLGARTYHACLQNDTGTAKKIRSTAAVQLLHAEAPTPKLVRSYSKVSIPDPHMRGAIREAEIAETMRGAPGVVQVFASIVVPSKLAPKMRVHMVMEAMNLDLCDAINECKILKEHKPQIAKGLIYGLTHMHERGYYHGDIKIENALIRFEENDTKCIAKIGDFGFSAQFDVQSSLFAAHKGFYGTDTSTAPECLGDANFKGDFAKLDSYAMGITLYKLTEGKEPTWTVGAHHLYAMPTRPVDVYKKARTLISAAMQRKLRELLNTDQFKTIAANIPAFKERVQKGEKLTADELLDCLRWLYKKLLDPDPAKRWSLAQCKAEIDLLFPDFQVE